MRIQTITITDYKAFLGKHEINVAGKNLFIYGENGSGKSSLYYALKDFFQSSIEDIELSELENIFVSKEKKGGVSVKVTFTTLERKTKNYELSALKNDTRDSNDTSIR
ncbi:MAG: AAA family ATPase, partial [Desulfobulbaceae bacterium]|nr:AAA family ATPase [Desulfobulbaceae bacterium]